MPLYIAWTLSSSRVMLAWSGGTVLAECFTKSGKACAQHVSEPKENFVVVSGLA